MNINTLLDAIDQVLGWELPEESFAEIVQAQVGRLNSDEFGTFCLD